MTFEDGDSPDFTLAELQAILSPPGAHPRKLPGSTDWGLFKKQYALIGSALHEGFFSGAARPFMAKAFRILRPETMTAKWMKGKPNSW